MDTKETLQERPLKPTDLRGILRYVPMFWNDIFILAIDGSIVEDDNFQNLITDIAVLRSLNIRVVIVHGIGKQLREAAERQHIQLSDVYGEHRTDESTMTLAREVLGYVSQTIIEGLTRANLKCAITNAIRATEVGVIDGVDQGYTGKVEKIDIDLINSLLNQGIVPLVTPMLSDRNGRSFRVNSDAIAAHLAVELKASKLIYLTPYRGLMLDGALKVNMHLDELLKLLDKKNAKIEPRIRGKAQFAVQALLKGTQRAHILDGRVNGGLLAEIFDNVGTGTMIHVNEYDSIRPARRKDIPFIFNITKNAVKNKTLATRTRQQIEEKIEDYFVFEIDGSIIGCSCLRHFKENSKVVELCSVFVQEFYQTRGVGKKLVAYAEDKAKKAGAKHIVTLTTQTYGFFKDVCGFVDAGLEKLPKERRAELSASGRNSKVLIKDV